MKKCVLLSSLENEEIKVEEASLELLIRIASQNDQYESKN
jgi:hypothetical protein